jgi:hypothetical protein
MVVRIPPWKIRVHELLSVSRSVGARLRRRADVHLADDASPWVAFSLMLVTLSLWLPLTSTRTGEIAWP